MNLQASKVFCGWFSADIGSVFTVGKSVCPVFIGSGSLKIFDPESGNIRRSGLVGAGLTLLE